MVDNIGAADNQSMLYSHMLFPVGTLSFIPKWWQQTPNPEARKMMPGKKAQGRGEDMQELARQMI